MAQDFGPRLEVDARGPKRRLQRLRKIVPRIAEKALASETQILHRMVRKNLAGPKRKRYDPGPSARTLPVGRRSNTLLKAVRTTRKTKHDFRVWMDEGRAAYAKAIEDGWKSSIIRPRIKKALAWVISGRRPHGKDGAAWGRAVKAERGFVVGEVERPSRGGTHYFATAVEKFRRTFFKRIHARVRHQVKKTWGTSV